MQKLDCHKKTPHLPTLQCYCGTRALSAAKTCKGPYVAIPIWWENHFTLKSTLMAGLLVYAKKINALRMIAYYYAFLRIISHYYVLLRKLLHGKNRHRSMSVSWHNKRSRWFTVFPKMGLSEKYPPSEIFCIGIKLLQNCCGCRYNKLARLANFVAIFHDHRNFPGDIGLTRE